MTDRQMLEAILNKISEMDASMATKGDLSGVKDDLKGVKGELSGVKDDLKGVKGELSGVKDEITELNTEIKFVKETVIKIENEHGQKLAALFDGYKHNSEILTDHTLCLERIEKKFTTHDIQIHVLEKTKDSKR
ncbi:hypothetical protein [Candidatus Contubernalis alkaliaceticus]|uniref:hypothetical protein n=1 Tax=Candidatus Contubernalis alkaliaceticus TaxID=338645 RepID=UPI001F4C4151|nr:hypothetical protein [Candidatus Contubernalis alkalaceticus]UNC91650.1 hypothetical protein HUE98_05820 [Candidatus Contubernalis alkalaceticus]